MSETFASDGLPPTEAVLSALEELIQTCEDRLRTLQAQPAQGEPDVSEEIRFFKRQYNAFTKAQFYWMKGIRPVAAGRDAWLIPSGSRPGGPVHRIVKRDGIWACGPSCEAHDQFHWHPAIIAAVERGYELADVHDDAAAFEPESAVDDEPFLPVPTAADFGRRLAAARAMREMNELFG